MKKMIDLSISRDQGKEAVTGFSLRIEVAGGYYKITGESGH